MKKKLVIIFTATLVISCLTACGKKNDDITNEVEHSYAINGTTEDTEETLDASDSEPVEPAASNSDERDYSDINADETTAAASGDIVYSYPNENDSGFYINSVRVAEVPSFGFSLNNTKANLKDGKDIITSTSIKNKIFCQGYSNNLKLVDTDILTTTDYSYQRLSPIAEAIDYIKLGSEKFVLNDLLYSTEKFNDMILMLGEKYKIECENGYKQDDIKSYAHNTGNNNVSGYSYEWVFSWNNNSTEYTAEELSILSSMGKLPDSYIRVIGAYDSEDNLVYYIMSIEKAAHFWVEEITHEAQTGAVDFDENGNITNEQITDTQTIHTGKYSKSQDGFDFNDAYIKIKDGSYIGLNKVSITIHNPNNSFNSKLTLDYNVK